MILGMVPVRDDVVRIEVGIRTGRSPGNLVGTLGYQHKLCNHHEQVPAYTRHALRLANRSACARMG